MNLHMFFIAPAESILEDEKAGDESLMVKRTLQAAESILGNRADIMKNKLAVKELQKIKVPKDAIIWIISETASSEDNAYTMRRNQVMPDTEKIKPPDDVVDKIVSAMLEIPITELQPSPKQLQQLQVTNE